MRNIWAKDNKYQFYCCVETINYQPINIKEIINS